MPLKYHNTEAFDPEFINHLERVKTQLFAKSTKTGEFASKSLVELMGESGLDIEYMSNIFIRGKKFEGQSGSESQCLFATALMTLEINRHLASESLHDQIKNRLICIETFFSKNRHFFNPSAGTMFDVLNTCPAHDQDLKINLSARVMQLFCEPLVTSASNRTLYFFKQTADCLVSSFFGIPGTDFRVENPSSKEFLDPGLLFKNKDYVLEILKASGVFNGLNVVKESIDYFAFNYLVVAGIINYLIGKQPSAIRRGVEQCCMAIARHTHIESLAQQMAEAVNKRIFLIDHDISTALKTSAYDLIDPTNRFSHKQWSAPHAWNSLFHSDPFMSKGLRAESLARFIKQMPGMTENLAKRSNLQSDFPCAKTLVGTLIHLDNTKLNQAFLDSNLTLNSLVAKSLLKRYDGQLSSDLELAIKLKHVQYLAVDNPKQKINKLPFTVDDRAPFIKHLLQHKLLLKPSMVSLLKLSLDDLHLVDPKQHALFKRIVLSRDLEI